MREWVENKAFLGKCSVRFWWALVIALGLQGPSSVPSPSPFYPDSLWVMDLSPALPPYLWSSSLALLPMDMAHLRLAFSMGTL